MPCFHGLAVSIHTPDGPLAEHSIQRQSKHHRINSYIAVPPPKVQPDSGLPKQSTFAISITLLTPGTNVPYSTPKETPDDPYPQAKTVGSATSDLHNSLNKRPGNIIAPYVQTTSSPNETVAAYIYFDGRAKEEVATLLRRGEETWVNSRWVSVSDSEGGGLAEREFLFREVGLERWLNGLDLDSKDGDDVPQSEAQGQIKVALFRVLASGEIKRGEYSPQFDAHDDDDLEHGGKDGGSARADVDHTTSFAQPKTLDPKSITTQTVSGIDPPDKPYAVFTFLYRGERQLQKMGILPPLKPKNGSANGKKPGVVEFLKSTPLKTEKAVKNFSGYRDPHAAENSVLRNLLKKRKDGDDMDSEDDLDDGGYANLKPAKRVQGDEDREDAEPKKLLSLEDAARQAILTEGVKKIHLLKRQASQDPLSIALAQTSPTFNQPSTPSIISGIGTGSIDTNSLGSPQLFDDTNSKGPLSPALDLDKIGSPFKRARASNIGVDITSVQNASVELSNFLNAKPDIILTQDEENPAGDTVAKMDEV